jgi:hypothetical protein
MNYKVPLSGAFGIGIQIRSDLEIFVAVRKEKLGVKIMSGPEQIWISALHRCN